MTPLLFCDSLLRMIKDNIARIKDDISLVCSRLGINPQDIILLCVTKTATPEMVFEALENGITEIAENRVVDAENKFSALKQIIKNSQRNFPVKYHMIGHLQSNKVKKAVSIFDLIQSMDSLHLAKEIEKQAQAQNKTADCLIEVKASSEATKFGVSPEETLQFIEEISKLKSIHISGLMTIAAETSESEEIRNSFRKLRKLKETISQEFNSPNISMKYLSMGMTNDYKIALEEGSNMLRIGRAIFKNSE